jgi:hypothetical protein
LRISLKTNSAWRRELAPGDRRLWLLGSVALRIELGSNPLWVFEVFWKRLLTALGILGLFSYLAAVTAVFLWLDRQPHNRVGWGDVFALPLDYEGFRRKRGDSAVESGLAHLKAQQYPDAFYNLRIGLSRSPGHVEGRLALARLYLGAQPAQAAKLLEEGLAHGADDLKLLGSLFAVLNLQQAHTRAIEVGDALLAGRHGKLSVEALRTVAHGRVSALLGLGRFDDALAAIRALPLEAPGTTWSARRHLLEADTLLRLGRAAEANTLYRAARADGRIAQDEPRLESELAVALDDADALRSALRRLKAAAPDSPAPYIQAFHCWHRLKRITYREAALAEFYRLFARNDAALQLLAATLVNLGLPDEVRRAQRVAVQSRLSPFAFHVHLTEIALRQGDFAQATRLLREWEDKVDTLPVAQRAYPELIKRLVRAAFSPDSGQQENLLSHLREGALVQLPVLLLTMRTLDTAGAFDTARQVQDLAEKRYPDSDPVRQWRETLATRAAAVVEKTTSAPVPAAAASIPAKSSEALAQIDRHLDADDIAGARDLLRAVHAQRPAWLAEHEAEVSLRELRLALAALDTLTTRTLTRTYLRRFAAPDAARRLFPIISGLLKANRVADAKVLHDEIRSAHSANIPLNEELAALNVPDDLAGTVATAEAAYAALDRALANEQWVAAEQILQRLAAQPPAWLAESQTGVKVRETRLYLGLGQKPRALAVLKEIAVKAGAPRSAAFKLARDLHAAGRQEQALLLAQEIARLLPGDAAAEKLVREMQAPSPVDGAP